MHDEEERIDAVAARAAARHHVAEGEAVAVAVVAVPAAATDEAEAQAEEEAAEITETAAAAEAAAHAAEVVVPAAPAAVVVVAAATAEVRAGVEALLERAGARAEVLLEASAARAVVRVAVEAIAHQRKLEEASSAEAEATVGEEGVKGATLLRRAEDEKTPKLNFNKFSIIFHQFAPPPSSMLPPPPFSPSSLSSLPLPAACARSSAALRSASISSGVCTYTTLLPSHEEQHNAAEPSRSQHVHFVIGFATCDDKAVNAACVTRNPVVKGSCNVDVIIRGLRNNTPSVKKNDAGIVMRPNIRLPKRPLNRERTV